MTTWCDTYWGSHACDLPAGHNGAHVCATSTDEPCCEHDGNRIRFWSDAWGEWMPTTPAISAAAPPSTDMTMTITAIPTPEGTITP